MKVIRVVLVDQNAQRRNVVKVLVGQSPDMQCLIADADSASLRERVLDLHPDVVLLDEKLLRSGDLGVSCPGFESISFVRIPPIDERWLSSDANHSAGSPFGLPAYGEVVRKKIRLALQGPVTVAALDVAPSLSADVILPRVPRRHGKTEPVIVVGASTGGTEALKEFLQLFPVNAPAILVAQHMPEMFTRSFAARLDSFCNISVKEAVQGERVLPGHAYIAPGHSHLMLGMAGNNYVCELSQGSPVNRHRPSVDVLFRSAANVAGRNAIGVILTGMGRDGAIGMLEMKQSGAYNFAQDEASCVVFGMPKEAIALGGADEVLSLREIAPRIRAWLAQSHGLL